MVFIAQLIKTYIDLQCNHSCVKVKNRSLEIWLLVFEGKIKKRRSLIPLFQFIAPFAFDFERGRERVNRLAFVRVKAGFDFS